MSYRVDGELAEWAMPTSTLCPFFYRTREFGAFRSHDGQMGMPNLKRDWIAFLALASATIGGVGCATSLIHARQNQRRIIHNSQRLDELEAHLDTVHEIAHSIEETVRSMRSSSVRSIRAAKPH